MSRRAKKVDKFLTDKHIIGGTGAILAEIRHLSAGNWAYTESMPVLPFVSVGIVPVLQFMILPVVIFYVSLYLLSVVKDR